MHKSCTCPTFPYIPTAPPSQPPTPFLSFSLPGPSLYSPIIPPHNFLVNTHIIPISPVPRSFLPSFKHYILSLFQHDTLPPSFQHPTLPSFHYPTLPSFHYPTLPSFHYSTLPSSQHPTLPSFQNHTLPSFQHTSLPSFGHPSLPSSNILPSHHFNILPSHHFNILPSHLHLSSNTPIIPCPFLQLFKIPFLPAISYFPFFPPYTFCSSLVLIPPPFLPLLCPILSPKSPILGALSPHYLSRCIFISFFPPADHSLLSSNLSLPLFVCFCYANKLCDNYDAVFKAQVIKK